MKIRYLGLAAVFGLSVILMAPIEGAKPSNASEVSDDSSNVTATKSNKGRKGSKGNKANNAGNSNGTENNAGKGKGSGRGKGNSGKGNKANRVASGDKENKGDSERGLDENDSKNGGIDIRLFGEVGDSGRNPIFIHSIDGQIGLGEQDVDPKKDASSMRNHGDFSRGQHDQDQTPTLDVPEPSTWVMLGTLLLIGVLLRARKQRDESERI